jgi:uncharacterized membrane protein/quercetin dioxygenase-like cupin family protein
MSPLVTVALWCAAIGCGLMAGVYFTFSAFAMAALGGIAADRGIAAMQAINRVILKSLFMPLFLGTTALSVALAGVAIVGWRDRGDLAMLVAGVVYFVSMFGVTAAFNVPLNNALDAVGPGGAEGAALWARYLRDWTRWNHVRTAGSTLACGLFIWSLVDRGAREPAPDPAGGSALGAATSVTVVAGPPDGPGFRAHPLRPMSEDVEILLGHPDSAGRPFVIRIHELPGTVVPPHSHPVDEHITVVSGTWHFGIGQEFDSTALRPLPAGTYAFAPAGVSMFAASPEAAVVQVHGTGPFRIRWRHGLLRSDEPGADSVFRFRAGQSVAGPRGPGRVVVGYASGALVQYEIRGEDGRRYMAHQRDLLPR